MIEQRCKHCTYCIFSFSSHSLEIEICGYMETDTLNRTASQRELWNEKHSKNITTNYNYFYRTYQEQLDSIVKMFVVI